MTVVLFASVLALADSLGDGPLCTPSFVYEQDLYSLYYGNAVAGAGSNSTAGAMFECYAPIDATCALHWSAGSEEEGNETVSLALAATGFWQSLSIAVGAHSVTCTYSASLGYTAECSPRGLELITSSLSFEHGATVLRAQIPRTLLNTSVLLSFSGEDALKNALQTPPFPFSLVSLEEKHSIAGVQLKADSQRIFLIPEALQKEEYVVVKNDAGCAVVLIAETMYSANKKVAVLDVNAGGESLLAFKLENVTHLLVTNAMRSGVDPCDGVLTISTPTPAPKYKRWGGVLPGVYLSALAGFVWLVVVLLGVFCWWRSRKPERFSPLQEQATGKAPHPLLPSVAE